MTEKSIARKLLIKAGYKILIVNAPDGYTNLIGELPEGVTVLKKPQPGADLIQVFLKSEKELEEQLPRMKESLTASGLLWVMYPKGTSKIPFDINYDIIAAYARTIGMVGIAMISIDETWSALRLKKT